MDGFCTSLIEIPVVPRRFNRKFMEILIGHERLSPHLELLDLE